MALKIGDFFEDLGPAGVVAGVGTAVFAPFLATKVGKPLAKGAIKGGLVAYERSRGFFAEAEESFEDMKAEAKAELAEENSQAISSGESDTKAD
jgi:hypothetical protein